MNMTEKLSTRINENLTRAIKTMRDACDDAERRADTTDDSRACREVMHTLVWGFANASSSIESATSALEDLNNVKLFNEQERVRD